MIESAKVRILLSELEKSRSVLARMADFYDRYLKQTQDARERTTEQVIVLADILVNYYTCLETIFLRISHFFENELSPLKWHQDLLGKMTLSIEGIREPVISDETASLLSELLKFRHFKRYYFEFEYDWDRIDFLRKKFGRLRPPLESDLDHFTQFLRRLAEEPEESPSS
jgi:hypothetical protein